MVGAHQRLNACGSAAMRAAGRCAATELILTSVEDRWQAPLWRAPSSFTLPAEQVPVPFAVSRGLSWLGILVVLSLVWLIVICRRLIASLDRIAHSYPNSSNDFTGSLEPQARMGGTGRPEPAPASRSPGSFPYRIEGEHPGAGGSSSALVPQPGCACRSAGFTVPSLAFAWCADYAQPVEQKYPYLQGASACDGTGEEAVMVGAAGEQRVQRHMDLLAEARRLALLKQTIREASHHLAPPLARLSSSGAWIGSTTGAWKRCSRTSSGWPSERARSFPD